MSRHYFDTHYQNRPVEVDFGYDRRLGQFFLTVLYTESAPASDNAESADEDDTIIYSDLADPDAGPGQDLDYFRAKLTSLGITVPESMFREIEQDAIRQVGNRIVRHYEDGRLEEIGEVR